MFTQHPVELSAVARNVAQDAIGATNLHSNLSADSISLKTFTAVEFANEHMEQICDIRSLMCLRGKDLLINGHFFSIVSRQIEYVASQEPAISRLKSRRTSDRTSNQER
jgi:hypothetical protein